MINDNIDKNELENDNLNKNHISDDTSSDVDTLSESKED